MEQTENFNMGMVQPSPDEGGYRHPSFVKREIARVYNRTGGALLIHYLILFVIQIAVLGCMGYYQFIRDMAMGNEVDAGRLGLMMLVSTAVSYIIANVSAYFIGLHFSRRLKGSSDMFQRSELGPSVIIPAMLATVGIQGIVIIIQLLYINITGDQGMSEATSSLLSFGDDTLTNVLLFIYMVILGPVTEELVFRGMALKNFSAVSRRFGIIMSSIAFGLFHGNVLQFITGFALGMFFSYIDIKANSIVPSIILHIFNNLTSALINLIFADASAETIAIVNVVYIAADIVLGIIGFILLRKKLFGKNEQPEEGSEPKHEVYAEFLAEETRGMDGLTWKTAAKSPCLWIFAIFYILMIISPMLLSALVSKYPAFFS
ncbi:MAG: lysostaphin resistance A-like protein [Oscillospiraceae bacterium]